MQSEDKGEEVHQPSHCRMSQGKVLLRFAFSLMDGFLSNNFMQQLPLSTPISNTIMYSAVGKNWIKITLPSECMRMHKYCNTGEEVASLISD